MHRADAADEQVGRGRLEHDPARAEPDCLEQLLLVDVGGEHDHAPVEPFSRRVPQHLHAVDPGHAQVQDQDVGPVLPQRPQRRLAVPAARDDLDVRLPLEQALKPPEHERVVVSQGEPDRRHPVAPLTHGRTSSSRASAAVARNPRMRNGPPSWPHESKTG